MDEDGTAAQARAEAPAAAAEPAAAAGSEQERPEGGPALLPGCLSFCLGGLALLLGGIGLVMLYLGLRDHFSASRHLTEPMLGVFLSLVFLVPACLLGCGACVLSVLGRRRP